MLYRIQSINDISMSNFFSYRKTKIHSIKRI